MTKWQGFPFENFTNNTRAVAKRVVNGDQGAMTQVAAVTSVTPPGIDRKDIVKLKMNEWIGDWSMHCVARHLVKDMNCVVLSPMQTHPIKTDTYNFERAFDYTTHAAKSAGKVPGTDINVLECDKRNRRAKLNGRAIGFMVHVNSNHYVTAWYEPEDEWFLGCMEESKRQQYRNRVNLWMMDSFYDSHEDLGKDIVNFLKKAGIVAANTAVNIVQFNNIARQYMAVDIYNCGAFCMTNVIAMVNKQCPFHGINVCSSFRLARQCREYMVCVLLESHAGRTPLHQNIIGG